MSAGDLRERVAQLAATLSSIEAVLSAYSLDELVALGTLPASAAAFLEAAVVCRAERAGRRRTRKSLARSHIGAESDGLLVLGPASRALLS